MSKKWTKGRARLIGRIIFADLLEHPLEKYRCIKEHLRVNNKNGHIRDFLREFDGSFRYIQFSKNWKEEEARLYNLFVATYGAPPKCNRVRPYCINS